MACGSSHVQLNSGWSRLAMISKTNIDFSFPITHGTVRVDKYGSEPAQQTLDDLWGVIYVDVESVLKCWMTLILHMYRNNFRCLLPAHISTLRAKGIYKV